MDENFNPNVDVDVDAAAPAATTPATTTTAVAPAVTPAPSSDVIAKIKARVADAKHAGSIADRTTNAKRGIRIDGSFPFVLAVLVRRSRNEGKPKSGDASKTTFVNFTNHIVPIAVLENDVPVFDREFVEIRAHVYTPGPNAKFKTLEPVTPGHKLKWYFGGHVYHVKEGPFQTGSAYETQDRTLQPGQVVLLKSVKLHSRQTATDTFFEVVCDYMTSYTKLDLPTYVRSMPYAAKRLALDRPDRIAEYNADVLAIMGEEYVATQAKKRAERLNGEPDVPSPLTYGANVHFLDVDNTFSEKVEGLLLNRTEFSVAVPEAVSLKKSPFSCKHPTIANKKVRCIRPTRDGYNDDKMYPLMSTLTEVHDYDETGTPKSETYDVYTFMWSESCLLAPTRESWEDYAPSFFMGMSGIAMMYGVTSSRENEEVNVSVNAGKSLFVWCMRDVVRAIGVRVPFDLIKSKNVFTADERDMRAAPLVDGPTPPDYEDPNYSPVSTSLQNCVNLAFVDGNIERLIEAEKRGAVEFWVVSSARAKARSEIADVQRLESDEERLASYLRRSAHPAWYAHVESVSAYGRESSDDEFVPAMVYAVSVNPADDLNKYIGPALPSSAKRARVA